MRTASVRSALLAALLALGLTGCSFFRQIGFAPNEPDPASLQKDAPSDEPEHVLVQHVLISFEGLKVAGVTRTRDEAERLARRVESEARAGRDFAELVRTYSDDRGDGRYALANWGVAAGPEETERRKMVRGFGAMAFSLQPGEVGVVPYDTGSSPFGWHIVKRVK